MCFLLLVGLSDMLPGGRDSPGTELKPDRAHPLLHETEPHQLRFQHHHHEPARRGRVGESL